MKPVFAGIDSELYLDPKTGRLVGDARRAPRCADLLSETE
jgi:hypothetical protein